MSKYTPAPKSIPNRLGLEERERADSQRSGDNPKRLTLGQEQRSETRSRTESTRADGMTLIGIRVNIVTVWQSVISRAISVNNLFYKKDAR